MGLTDVLIIPAVLGFRLQPYLIPIFLLCSFSAFILSPAIKNQIVTTISIAILLVFWTLVGLLLGWSLGSFVNLFINSLLAIYSKQPIQLDDTEFALVLATLCFLCSLCLHLVLVFNTEYVNERIKHKIKRSRSKRR
jgi:hypothetical protein